MASIPTILVVEDEFASLEVLTMMLEAKGYIVLTASDGQEALEILLNQPVELLITDYMMPRMSGATLCLELDKHERFKDLPVIMMSANDIEDVDPPPRIVAFFIKPLLFDELLATVENLVGEPA